MVNNLLQKETKVEGINLGSQEPVSEFLPSAR